MIKLEDFGIGSLSKRTLWVGASRTIAFATLLFTNVFLARRLTRGDFGQYQQSWLFIKTMTPILLLGITQALNYHLPSSDAEKSRAYVSAFFLIIILTGSIGLCLTLLFPGLTSRIIGNPELAAITPILGLYVFFILPFYLLEPLLILKRRVRELFLWTAAFDLAFIAIVLKFGSMGRVKALFVGFVFLALIKTLTTFGRTASIYGPGKWLFARVLRPPLIRYLSVLGGIATIDVLSLHIDKYIVSHFLGANAYAIYAIGSMEMPFVIIITSSVTAIIMPELSHCIASKRSEDVIRLIHRSIEKISYLIFPVFTYLLITCGFYITFLFGGEYIQSVPIFYVYLCLIPIRALNSHPYLIAAGLQRYALYARIIDISIDILLGIILIRWIGILGPAVAMLIASYVHKAYQTMVLCRHLRLNLRRAYPWGSLGRVMLTAGISAVALKMILVIFGETLLAVIVGTSVFCVIYLGIIGIGTGARGLARG